MVELLVGCGADLNTTGQDGGTALHMLPARGPDLNMCPDMNQLKKVRLGEAYFNNMCFIYLLFDLCYADS